MKRAIKKLADSMGVTEADVMCLARSVINSLEKDKVVDTFKGATDEERADITLAYVVDADKKWQQFVSIYKTQKGADDLFRQTVLKLQLLK